MENGFRVNEKLHLGNLATFIPNKNLPVYNWFYYKEGFSRDFVFTLADEFRLLPGKTLLEPFCGSGTTNLACRQMGIDSFGFDVLPISVFVSRVKTTDYDIENLREASKQLLKTKFVRPRNLHKRVSAFVQKSFMQFTLDDAILFRDKINETEDLKIRDFLLLALMDSTMKCSLMIKDGACLKRVSRNIPPLREMLKRKLHFMIRDLENFESEPCKTVIGYGDARRIGLDDESIDSVITSPPYLNKIEYTNIYRIEEELFLPSEHMPGIRSFIGTDDLRLNASEFETIDFPIPLAAKPYFSDMKKVISELYRVCKPGARLAIVVGDGYLQEQVVDSSYILSKLAKNIGFKVNEIVVMNKRVATTPSRHRVGILKESMLLWEKE